MAVLGWSVQAGEKSKEWCLRRHCRCLPQSLADEAGRGDGGVVVFQRARQIGGNACCRRFVAAHDRRAVLRLPS